MSATSPSGSDEDSATAPASSSLVTANGDPDDGVPLRVGSADGVLVVLDPYEDGVARLGLVVQGGLGQQLAGGGVDVEEVGAEAAQAVGQRVAVEVRGGDGLADVGARRRVLGYRAGCPVAFRELRRPVLRRAAAPAAPPTTATTTGAATTAGAALHRRLGECSGCSPLVIART